MEIGVKKMISKNGHFIKPFKQYTKKHSKARKKCWLDKKKCFYYWAQTF